MTIDYWITSTLNVLPAVLWMFAGLGIPYALAALPRKDWSDYGLVGAVALAFGPAVMTAWMFVLGTMGGANQSALLTAPNILGGSLVLFVIALAIVLYKRRAPLPDAPPRKPFTLDEKLIIGLIFAAMVVRVVTTAYWPFIHYDPLWVYGYQGRIFSLQGFISPDIGYYPQFLQLQYVYAQVVSGQVIDDHAARAVIPFLHLGSILITYALGSRLFTRRVGIIAAGLWALYPHVGQWATVGDLEIPTMYGFTGAAAFFLVAWFEAHRRLRWHYAMLAGLFLGIAMWTKPTAGAYILGVALMVIFMAIIALIRVGTGFKPVPTMHLPTNRTVPTATLISRFEVAVITGIFSIPLGALWYVRNILLGHDALVFPNDFWLTQAMRSGVEFGWILLALVLLLFALWQLPSDKRPNRMRFVMIGALVFVVALLPTIIAPRRMNLLEFAGVGAGVALMAYALIPYVRRRLDAQAQHKVAVIAWAWVLAFPYFLNWFWNYSYHYRLSFAIVPLLLLPSAVLLDVLFKPVIVRKWRALAAVGIVLAGLPAVVIPLYSYIGGWDYLWSGEFPTDWDRVASFNGGLAFTVRDLENRIAEDGFVERDETPVIVAPGLQRLPFFFPTYDVRIDTTPTTFAELEGVDYYIYTQEAVWLYEENGLDRINQVVGSLNRPQIYDYFANNYDGLFWSQAYRVRNLERRFRPPRGDALAESVVFGDFARLYGYRTRTEGGTDDEALILTLIFESLQNTDGDYVLAVELVRDAEIVTSWNSFVAASDRTYYSTRLWESGEYIIDEHKLALPEGMRYETGDEIRIGFYIPSNGDPLSIEDATFAPIIVDGETVEATRYTLSMPPANTDQ